MASKKKDKNKATTRTSRSQTNKFGGLTSPTKKESKRSKSPKGTGSLALNDLASGITYGDEVQLKDGRSGTIRYIGTPAQSQFDVWLGISLTDASGTNDGSERGVQYWKDKPKHGTFVKPDKIKKILKRKAGSRLTINDIVKHSKKGKAIIRYVGELETRKGELTYGIELLEKIGKNNGYDKKGNFMFQCSMSRGLFVKQNDISILSRASKVNVLEKSEFEGDSGSEEGDEKDNENNENEDDDIDDAQDYPSDIDADNGDDAPTAFLEPSIFSAGGTIRVNPMASKSGKKGKNKMKKSSEEEEKKDDFEDVFYIPPAGGIDDIHIDPSATALVNDKNEAAGQSPSPQKDSDKNNTEMDVPGPAFSESSAVTISADAIAKDNKPKSKLRDNSLVVKKERRKSRRASQWMEQVGTYAWLFDFSSKIEGKKANLKVTADGPFDVATSREEFEYISETIMQSCNNPTKLFKVLHGLTNRLHYDDKIYRRFDTTHFQLDDAFLKYDGVKSFLSKLGYIENGKKELILPSDQPPLDVLETAKKVCSNYVFECKKKREAIDVIKQFKLMPPGKTSMNTSMSRGKNVDEKKSDKGANNEDENEVNLDSDDEDVTFNDEVDGETDRVQLADIVWSITDENSIDTNNDVIRDVLLLTHRTWTTSKDLIDCIEERFFGSYEEEDYGQYDDNGDGGDGGDGAADGAADGGGHGGGGHGGGGEDDQDYGEEDGYNDIILSSFRVATKCVDLLQGWMRTYWNDDFDDDLCNRISHVIERAINGCKTAAKERYFTDDPSMPAKQKVLIQNLKKTFDACQKKSDEPDSAPNKSKKTLDMSTKSSKNKKIDGMMDLSSTFSKIKKKFMDLDNKKIAQQLTLMDFEIFRQIKRRECLSQSWKKANKDELSPHIVLLIDQFNRVTKWVQLTVLDAENEKTRGKIIGKFLKVCNELYEMHNFQSLCAVFGALNSTAIHNLKSAWSFVKSKYVARFEDFKSMFSALNNMSNLRKEHRDSDPPMIPYSGVFLKDMIAVEEGNSKRKEDGTVNFARMLRLRELIDKTLLYQYTPYAMEEDVTVKGYILYEFGENEKVDDDEIYVKAKAIRTATMNSKKSSLRLIGK